MRLPAQLAMLARTRNEAELGEWLANFTRRLGFENAYYAHVGHLPEHGCMNLHGVRGASSQPERKANSAIVYDRLGEASTFEATICPSLTRCGPGATQARENVMLRAARGTTGGGSSSSCQSRIILPGQPCSAW